MSSEQVQAGGAALRRRPTGRSILAAVLAFALTALGLTLLNGSEPGPATPPLRHSAIPGNQPEFVTTFALGTLATNLHHFEAGLRWGQEAHRLAPESVRPLGLIADGQIELGRYADAARTLQRMVDLKPNLSSYSRVSYYRELHGDLPGAIAAMRLAVSAGGNPESTANVQTLLGNLELQRGQLSAARQSYRSALARVPEYPAALAGLARADAVSGNLDGAIRRYQDVLTKLPLPEYVIGLGETELVSGRSFDFELVHAEHQLLNASGVDTDVELAVFEADHGDPQRAVELARAGYRRAPSVRAADSYGWALTSAGRPDSGLVYARKALRLGSVEPIWLYHAGIAARDAGEPALAKRWLTRALEGRFAPYHEAAARRALAGL